MKSRSLVAWACLAFLAAAGAGVRQAAAAERSAAELLPPSTVVYAEIAEPQRLLETALNHPLRTKLEALEDVQKQLNSQQIKVAQFIVAMVEQKIGMKLQEAVVALSEGGVYLGVDTATEGGAVLIRARDQQTLETIKDTLMQLGRQQAEQKGEDDPFKSRDYRGVSAIQAGKGIVVQLGPWLVLANQGDLAKSIVDRYLDGGESLAQVSNFQDARKSLQGKPALWGFADLATLRGADSAKGLFREKHDNPAAELLLGGALTDLQHAPFITASLYAENQRLGLNVSLPHDADWIPQRREYFFGQDGKQSAPRPLLPNETLLSIEAHRDVRAWWLAKEDLYVESVVAKLAQADSQFSTLFAGLDFGQEVLGALKPGAQIVVTRQNFDELDTYQPGIKLPAGAMIFQLSEPEKVWRRLKVAYQSALALINLNLGQKQQPQLEMETHERGDARIISASYLPDEGHEGAINYNFSPSIAFIGDRFIIASTRELANELVDLAVQADGDPQDGPNHNTHARLDLTVLHQVLHDNHQQLVTQTALKKGKDKAAAEKEIDTALELLSAVSDVTLRLTADDDTLQFDLELTFVD